MGIAIIQTIQGFSNPVWDLFFEGITMLGEPVLLILLFTFIYWAKDREAGESMAYTILLSLLVNGSIKDLVRAERPIGKPGVRSIHAATATGYSFPSAHAQNSAAFYTSMAQHHQWRRAAEILFLLLPPLIALSRVYLGLHYPRDVIAGLAFGYGVAWFSKWAQKKVKNWLLLYGATFILFLPFSLLDGASHDTIISNGCMAGFFLAMAFNRKYADFSTEIKRTVQIFRWLGGLAAAGLTAVFLKIVMPDGALWDMARYGLLVFSAFAGWPWLFTRIGK